MPLVHRVFPVVHHLDRATSFDQTALALALGADGVFLISHRGDDHELMDVARGLKQAHPNRLMGVNLLTQSALSALDQGAAAGLDMVWTDDPGVNSTGVTAEAETIAQRLKEHPSLVFFGSVAFKYQRAEPSPSQAASRALRLGMLPTTSGSGTGSAPSVEKMRAIRASIGPQARLAVASGMTVDNVEQFLPSVSDFLVATGVSRDENHFDEQLLGAFVRRVKTEAN